MHYLTDLSLMVRRQGNANKYSMCNRLDNGVNYFFLRLGTVNGVDCIHVEENDSYSSFGTSDNK